MRGGPINTKRVVISNTNTQNTSGGITANLNSNNIEDIMLRNKDKLLDKIPKNGQVMTIQNAIMKV